MITHQRAALTQDGQLIGETTLCNTTETDAAVTSHTPDVDCRDCQELERTMRQGPRRVTLPKT